MKQTQNKMKTIKDIQFTTDEITQIVRTSMLFNEEPCTYGPGRLVHWLIKDKGEVVVHYDTNEVQLVDFTGTMLDYCCIEGIYKGMEVGDYFTEK